MLEGDIDLGDVTEEEINAAAEAGDMDKLAALLLGNKTESTQDKEGESQTGEKSAASGEEDLTDESADQTDDKTDDKTETENKAEETAEAKTETDEKLDVATKDGKRTIPHEVLSRTRERARVLDEENQALKAKVAEYEGKSQQVNKFLATRGIDPNEITDAQALQLSKEELSTLDELDPVLGKAIRLLTENIANTQKIETTQSVSSVPSVPEHVAALKQNVDLSEWQKSDPDRWEFACSVDEKLEADPKFKNLSYAERFAEAARRTKIAFGDTDQAPAPVETKPQINKKQIAETAQKKVDEAMSSSTVPRSLSGLGKTPSAERSNIEVLADKTPAELLDAMANMSADKMMEMLSQIE